MREWSVTTGTAYPCVVMCMELLTAGTVLLCVGAYSRVCDRCGSAYIISCALLTYSIVGECCVLHKTLKRANLNRSNL